MFCKTCGTEITDENAKFCPVCGTPVSETPAAETQALGDQQPTGQQTQVMNTPQPTQQVPPQQPTQQVPPQYAPQQVPPQQPTPKKNTGRIVAIVVGIVVVVLGAVLLFGQPSGTSDASDDADDTTATEPADTDSGDDDNGKGKDGATSDDGAGTITGGDTADDDSGTSGGTGGDTSGGGTTTSMQTIGNGYVGTLQVPSSWQNRASDLPDELVSEYNVVYYADPDTEYTSGALSHFSFAQSIELLGPYPTSYDEAAYNATQALTNEGIYGDIDTEEGTFNGHAATVLTTTIPEDGVYVCYIEADDGTGHGTVEIICQGTPSTIETVLGYASTWSY